jgi:hypothetical protein
VFSTSKDHRQGDKAMAGCILVDNEKIQVRTILYMGHSSNISNSLTIFI